ncbi:sugar ABC transporter [Klebsiella michiganensis]|uniref:Sugar ABC transporter n=1 Tax=Klebsiella michiganensis TaxID=1134687 RepID=A0A7H4PII4_9ENTR|nr:sugar ABC transporter [Klebsiella michiganensis]
MEEAAQIDGCNSIQVLWYVVVPILKPAIISVALFQFMWSMNDFIGPLIYVYSVDKYPIALALKMSIDVTEGAPWNEILAMASISHSAVHHRVLPGTTLLRTGRYQQRN